MFKVMDIQFAQYLFHFCIKIPGIQFIHLHNGSTDPVVVLRFSGRFKFLDRVDHRVIMEKDIVGDGFFFHKNRILLKQHHIHFFIDP